MVANPVVCCLFLTLSVIHRGRFPCDVSLSVSEDEPLPTLQRETAACGMVLAETRDLARSLRAVNASRAVETMAARGAYREAVQRSLALNYTLVSGEAGDAAVGDGVLCSRLEGARGAVVPLGESPVAELSHVLLGMRGCETDVVVVGAEQLSREEREAVEGLLSDSRKVSAGKRRKGLQATPQTFKVAIVFSGYPFVSVFDNVVGNSKYSGYFPESFKAIAEDAGVSRTCPPLGLRSCR